MLPVPRGVLWWYICRVACKGPKSRSRFVRSKPAPCRGKRSVAHLWRTSCQICGGEGSNPKLPSLGKRGKGRRNSMWCARLPLSRPGDTVVVCAGRNWAALWVAFFLSMLLWFLSHRSDPKPQRAIHGPRFDESVT